jgi:lipoprotein-anchoring transpeptidase ErfK/SrfK
MQRACLLCLIYLSAVLMSSTTLAGPFSDGPAGERRSLPSAFAVPPAPSRVREAAAGGQLGGGFIEFLMHGGQQRPPGYRTYPADLGPGMVESPTQPGYLIMDPRFVRQEVAYKSAEEAGTIVINTRERMLYLVQGHGQALRYGIGVGRPGFTWSGVHHITQKREWPDWTPPDEMLKRRPDLPHHMAGGPDNPLGARAMYLGSTLYRIHGSNEPWTIGTQVSSGCIRMRNDDVIDLFGRVKIGAKVIVI